MDAILTFDLGGSSLRAALFDTKATLLKMVSCPVNNARGMLEQAEADPEVWWMALGALASELLEDKICAQAKICGIAITGITRTQIFLDTAGKVLRPAITWRDGRATAQAKRLQEMIKSSESYRTLGDHSPLSAYHPLARLLWVKEHEPTIMKQTRWVLQPKDFFNFRLTNMAAGDLISSANFLDHKTLEPPKDLLRSLGIDPTILPPLFVPETRLGSVQKEAPAPFHRLAGVPVFVSSMDSWCCCLGIGANRPGYAYNVTGTSEVMGIITEQWCFAPGLVTLGWGDDLVQLGGPSQAGGDCLTWFVEGCSDLLEQNRLTIPKVLTRLAHKSPSFPPLFLPYLAGERAPLWNSEARGVFFGLERTHTWIDFVWAIMEGVAFANRHILDLAEEATQERAREVRITGGAAHLDLWCQIKADVMGRELVRTTQPEAGIFGAALVALQGLGIAPDRRKAQAELVQEEKRFFPQPLRQAWYERRYRIYRSLYPKLKESFQDLTSLRTELTVDPH